MPVPKGGNSSQRSNLGQGAPLSLSALVPKCQHSALRAVPLLPNSALKGGRNVPKSHYMEFGGILRSFPIFHHVKLGSFRNSSLTHLTPSPKRRAAAPYDSTPPPPIPPARLDWSEMAGDMENPPRKRGKILVVTVSPLKFHDTTSRGGLWNPATATARAKRYVSRMGHLPMPRLSLVGSQAECSQASEEEQPLEEEQAQQQQQPSEEEEEAQEQQQQAQQQPAPEEEEEAQEQQQQAQQQQAQQQPASEEVEAQEQQQEVQEREEAQQAPEEEEEEEARQQQSPPPPNPEVEEGQGQQDE